jgi:biotin synthase-like enzyme
MDLIERANKVYLKNFKPVTWFERALFFSWYCNIRDCKFCHMSIKEYKKLNKNARRSPASLLAETFLCKKLNWKLGFISGGIGAYTCENFKELIKDVSVVNQDKLWLNIGALSKKELETYLSYTKGVVGSIETINKEIHKKVCPSKPMKPYLKMFEHATKLNLKKAITIILGLGEKIEDFEKLKDLIEEYEINKIHFYGLNPTKGTEFENYSSPTKEYQAEWIAKTRIEFPKIDIQCGIWKDKVNRVGLLLKAGSNSISKFPALKLFNTRYAKEIEKQAKLANRKFLGSLTRLPKINLNKIDKFKIDKDLKKDIKIKLKQYIGVMKRSKD